MLILCRMKRRDPASVNESDVAAKRAFALSLRKQGHSYEKIGQLLGTQFPHTVHKDETTFSAVYASKLVHEAIKDIYREDAKDMIALECERLDEWQMEAIRVLQTEHVTLSNGAVVRVHVRDEKGNMVMDPETGLPKSVPIRDDAPVLAAIDRLVKISETRRKLLGLDKPTKVASTNPNGDKAATPFQMVVSPTDAKL